MNEISFNNVLPEVFSQHTDLQSDVWQQNLTFRKGGLYLVEADSGKGKSTFCSYILGYRHDFSGDITFDGKSVKDNTVGEWVSLRQRSISHLFQELRLFPELSAMENVLIKNNLTGHRKETEILEWFHRLGIEDKVNAKVGRMSFGQQQRVALMRALCQPFDFLLADEPVSHLDDKNGEIMGEIMMEEAQKQGAAVIVTSIGKHIDLNYERVLHL